MKKITQIHEDLVTLRSKLLSGEADDITQLATIVESLISLTKMLDLKITKYDSFIHKIESRDFE